MNQGWILGISAIFALSPLLIMESYGEGYKSYDGYTPSWAIPMKRNDAIDRCNNMSYSSDAYRDVLWCENFLDFYNKHVKPTFKNNSAKANEKKSPKTSNIQQKPISKSQTLSPKSFMVYENNLSSDYTLVESDPSIPIEGKKIVKSFLQNTFSHNGMITALVSEFYLLPDEVKQKWLYGAPMSDKIVFTLPDNLGKCQAVGNPVGSITCVLGNWSIASGINSDSNEDLYKFMDIMLKKYYQSQGKQFNQSTKDLVKNGQKIPKKELTYNEQINSLVNVDFIGCSASGSGNYLSWKGSLTSLATIPIDVDLVLTGLDSSKNIVTFEKYMIRDLYPGQTEYIDRFLDNNYEITSCNYKIERVKPSN